MSMIMDPACYYWTINDNIYLNGSMSASSLWVSPEKENMKDTKRMKQRWYSLLCVAEIAAGEGRHKQSSILVPKLNHFRVHSGDSLDREYNKRWPLKTKINKYIYHREGWILNIIINVACRGSIALVCQNKKKLRKKKSTVRKLITIRASSSYSCMFNHWTSTYF